MTEQPLNRLVESWLAVTDRRNDTFAVEMIDRMLETGRRIGAGDIHLQPAADGFELRYRIDGVLQTAGRFPSEVGPTLIARLKVIAELLTYRQDIPQEGRIRPGYGGAIASSRGTSANTVPDTSTDSNTHSSTDSNVEMRVSTFPTLFGERAVIRLFAQTGRFEKLDELGLPDDLAVRLSQLMAGTSGAILAVGPAGSGKTTTVYACLRHLIDSSTHCRSIVTLEDPIEMAIPGVAQSQVRPNVDLTLSNGVRFLMRQDPEVIMVGEIRDQETAEAALQASLTGHLLLSTFHAGSATEAVSRLAEMGIQSYLIRSGLKAIVSQRLVRRLCECATDGDPKRDDAARLGLPVERFRLPVGCEACRGTGYRGRAVLAELLDIEQPELRNAILSHSDSTSLENAAIESSMITRWQRAVTAVNEGVTSPAEIRRVLGVTGF